MTPAERLEELARDLAASRGRPEEWEDERAALVALLTAEVEPIRRMGVAVPPEVFRQGCRSPRVVCRWTRHRWGRLSHQRHTLELLEEET